MEQKERPILYWIRGNAERGAEVIRALKEKGGENYYNKDGKDDNCIYFIDYRGYIAKYDLAWYECKITMHYGTELTLPEKPKVLCWEDVKRKRGYNISCNFVDLPNDKTFNDTTGSIPFATEQQAKSAQAAAMISQIREQGKEVYGEIVPKGRKAYIIGLDGEGNITTYSLAFEYLGGLFRFENNDQAQLFLDNNKKLVKEYLKTF